MKHYINDQRANFPSTAVNVTGSNIDVLFRVENTGPIELYRIKTYHDPSFPIDSGWQKLCDIESLMPGDVRYCKRSITVTEEGFNSSIGRVQAVNANINHTGIINTSNRAYFNSDLP